MTWIHPYLCSMDDKIILLVEDNPNDEALTLRALKKNSTRNVMIVVRDGAEALDRTTPTRVEPTSTRGLFRSRSIKLHG